MKKEIQNDRISELMIQHFRMCLPDKVKWDKIHDMELDIRNNGSE